MICPNCKVNVPNNRFCNNCGAPLEVPFTNSLKNKGTWVIAPGEIARHISESDFANIAHLSGIIIQPGVSALIYSDGREIAQIGSGQYDFVSDKEIEDLANTRNTGWKSIRGIGINIWKAVTRIISGRKIGAPEKDFTKSQHTREEIIQHLNSASNISLYLKVDKPFPALFGYDPFKTGSDSFVPMKIRTRLFDVDVCVSLVLQISDFRECIRYYMTSKSSLTTGDIQAAISPHITRILQDVLRYEDIDENGISSEISNKIAARLLETERYLFGIKITGVPEITCDNKALERYRQLAKELYCSEKELDYLRRTNEFKNRLAAAELEQKVGESRSELELKVALDEVNKDRLLHNEEMEIFVQTLKTRKEDRENDLLESLGNSTIRKMEIAASVQKRELVISDELDSIKADLKFQAYKRDKEYESETIDIDSFIYGKRFAVKKRMLEDSFELEDIARKQQYKVNLENEDIKTALIGKQLEQKRLNDMYARDRRDDDYAHAQRVKEDEYQFKKRQKADEIDNFKKAQDISLSALERMSQLSESQLDNAARRESMRRQEEQRHEQYLAELARQKEMDRLQAENQKASIYSGMAASQIAATALTSGIEKGTISNEAVESIASIFTSEKEAAAAQAILRAREEDFYRANQEKDRLMQNQRDDMKEMMGMAFDFSREAMQNAGAERILREKEREEHIKQLSDVHSQRYEEMKEIKEEYREQMMHEQSRTDANQDKALDYTTKVTINQDSKDSKDKDSKDKEKPAPISAEKAQNAIHVNARDLLFKNE